MTKCERSRVEAIVAVPAKTVGAARSHRVRLGRVISRYADASTVLAGLRSRHCESQNPLVASSGQSENGRPIAQYDACRRKQIWTALLRSHVSSWTIVSAVRWKLIDGEPTPRLHDRSQQLTHADDDRRIRPSEVCRPTGSSTTSEQANRPALGPRRCDPWCSANRASQSALSRM